MKFLGGSSLSDAELAALSQSMVDEHGEAARDVVNQHIDAHGSRRIKPLHHRDRGDVKTKWGNERQCRGRR